MSPGMLVSPSHTTYCSEPMVQLGNGPTPVQVLPENFANVVQMFKYCSNVFQCCPNVVQMFSNVVQMFSNVFPRTTSEEILTTNIII